MRLEHETNERFVNQIHTLEEVEIPYDLQESFTVRINDEDRIRKITSPLLERLNHC